MNFAHLGLRTATFGTPKGSQLCLQQLQRAAQQDLVQCDLQFSVFFRRLLSYPEQGWRLLLPAVNLDVCVELHTKDTPTSSVSRSTTFGGPYDRMLVTLSVAGTLAGIVKQMPKLTSEPHPVRLIM